MRKEMTKITYKIKLFSVTTNGKFCDTRGTIITAQDFSFLNGQGLIFPSTNHSTAFLGLAVL